MEQSFMTIVHSNYFAVCPLSLEVIAEIVLSDVIVTLV